MMSESPSNPDDAAISIPLHPKHWVVVLGAIERLCQLTTKKVDDLKRQGVDHNTLDPAVISALAGPTIVRGIIIKELTARGLMKPEANAQLGIDRIMEEIRKFQRDE
jgi:hypothetical protein